MGYVIGVVSQKGGVGKSTIARLLGREYAVHGWDVKIGDLDVQQSTCLQWQRRRQENGIEPEVPVERFGTVDAALRAAGKYDLMVLDLPPHATKGTAKIAKSSDLIVIPTGLAVDDMHPTVLLAHEFVDAGVPRERIVIVFSKTGESFSEIQDARGYIEDGGYAPLKGWLQDRTGYRRALDEGRAVTETRFASLNEKADQVAQSIIDRFTEITEQQEAAE